MTREELRSRLRSYVRQSAELIPGELAILRSSQSTEEYHLTV